MLTDTAGVVQHFVLQPVREKLSYMELTVCVEIMTGNHVFPLLWLNVILFTSS